MGILSSSFGLHVFAPHGSPWTPFAAHTHTTGKVVLAPKEDVRVGVCCDRGAGEGIARAQNEENSLRVYIENRLARRDDRFKDGLCPSYRKSNRTDGLVFIPG